MNASLLNPFNITYPTAVQTSLPSQALLAKFDSTGRYVAAGQHNGAVLVWDLETRATVRWLEGHVRAITNIDWSRHSRFVLSSSKDWNINVWDLAADFDPPQPHTTLRFDAAVQCAWFHPKNSQIIAALTSSGDAYIIDLRLKYRSRVELEEPYEEGDEPHASGHFSTIRFNPSGNLLFCGTTAGMILVFNSRTKSLVGRHRLSGAGVIRGLEFTRAGHRLVTNSSDRVLRQFNLPKYPIPSDDYFYLDTELEPTHRFSDPINRNAWHVMMYSPDGEWLAGGASDNATHKIYIWDIVNDGRFTSTLDGGREPLLHAHWHPSKPSIVSTTNQGNVLIWHCPSPERWGAFAGGFEEVDENVEYEEREDEFDIEDENEISKRKMREEEEDVDIETGVELNMESPRVNGDLHDEDLLWAEDEPDEDKPGWKLRLIMVEDDDDM
ncbi:unnamed protein product [Peniophora sp. CBMAI 1063]|nr:unnamed protein product [Peniophora sp. CBMAI 1063]